LLKCRIIIYITIDTYADYVKSGIKFWMSVLLEHFGGIEV